MLTGSDFTLIWVTASTLTATPWLVKRSCIGATSKLISSSDSSREDWISGQTTAPPPLTTRVPPKP